MNVIKGALPCGTTAPEPDIACWIPDQNPSGTGLIIFPGGGYQGPAGHEGVPFAEYFSKQGIACFVSTYRLGTQGFRHPAMLEDALAAVYTVRSRAAEFGIDPDRLGVMGSSAGGHLSACTMTLWSRYSCGVSLRPDFGILCYPLIMTGEHTHHGSVRNLLGAVPDPALMELLSCEKQVSTETPPCFLWHTADDDVVPVENSLQFAAALSRNRVPFELHVYPHGWHGLGLATPFDWAADCVRWMHSLPHPIPRESV